jgi:hypothetical protein
LESAAAEQRALTARLVNLEIRSMVPERDWSESDEWEFLCECGTCQDRIALLPVDFDRRIAADEFILVPGHLFDVASEARRVARRLREESEALIAQAQQAVRRAKELHGGSEP